MGDEEEPQGVLAPRNLCLAPQVTHCEPDF